MGGASRRNTVPISGPQKLRDFEAFCDTSMHLIVCQSANKPFPKMSNYSLNLNDVGQTLRN